MGGMDGSKNKTLSVKSFLQKILDFGCRSGIPFAINGRWDDGLKACGAAGLPELRSRNPRSSDGEVQRFLLCSEFPTR